MKTFAMLIAVSLVLVFTAGCSTRIAYNNLDWLTVRWVNQQVSLEGDQRTMLRERLERQQLWHCATQLDRYQTWIEQLRLDLLAGRLDQVRLADHGDHLADFARALAERLQPMLVELAVSLDDEQVDQVLLALDERIDTLREEIGTRSDGQWAIDRVEGMERRLRRIMGSISPDQRRRLEQWADDLEPTHSYQLAQRLYWRERIASALSRRDDRAFLEQEISALVAPDSVWPDAYRRAIEANRELTLEALEEVVALTEPAQRDRISARLARLKNDFERLSCAGEAPPALIAAARSG